MEESGPIQRRYRSVWASTMRVDPGPVNLKLTRNLPGPLRHAAVDTVGAVDDTAAKL